MTLEIDALSDRLYADAFAGGIRSGFAFCDVRTTTAWEQIEVRVREQVKVHVTDLSATAAQGERAVEAVHAQWLELAPWDATLREIDLLSHVAKKLLQQDGRNMILRVCRKNPGREILRWRFVSLALPPGILIAAATERGVVVPKTVRILNASMAPDLSSRTEPSPSRSITKPLEELVGIASNPRDSPGPEVLRGQFREPMRIARVCIGGPAQGPRLKRKTRSLPGKSLLGLGIWLSGPILSGKHSSPDG